MRMQALNHLPEVIFLIAGLVSLFCIFRSRLNVWLNVALAAAATSFLIDPWSSVLGRQFSLLFPASMVCLGMVLHFARAYQRRPWRWPQLIAYFVLAPLLCVYAWVPSFTNTWFQYHSLLCARVIHLERSPAADLQSCPLP